MDNYPEEPKTVKVVTTDFAIEKKENFQGSAVVLLK